MVSIAAFCKNFGDSEVKAGAILWRTSTGCYCKFGFARKDFLVYFHCRGIFLGGFVILFLTKIGGGKILVKYRIVRGPAHSIFVILDRPPVIMLQIVDDAQVVISVP